MSPVSAPDPSGPVSVSDARQKAFLLLVEGPSEAAPPSRRRRGRAFLPDLPPPRPRPPGRSLFGLVKQWLERRAAPADVPLSAASTGAVAKTSNMPQMMGRARGESLDRPVQSRRLAA